MESSLRSQSLRMTAPASGRTTVTVASAVAISAVWVAVVLTGFFARDFVSGTQQQHIHLAALQNWFWGAIASGLILIPAVLRRPRDQGRAQAWYLLAGGSVAIWACVTVLSIFAPSQVTGSDPTRIPTAAILSPVVGTIGTGFLALFVTLLNRPD